MKISKILSTLLVFLILSGAYGQELLTSEREHEIRTSGRYFYGECSAYNEAEPFICAINDLTQKVIVDMVRGSNEAEIKNALEMNVKTAMLINDGRIIAFAWVEKESVQINPVTTITAAPIVATISTPPTSAAQEVVFRFHETAPENIRQTMQNNATAVFRAIQDAHFNNRQGITLSTSNATPEAIARIQALWSTSRFYSRAPEINQNVLETPLGWQVRNIPVFFSEGEIPEQQLVLEFARNGLITDIFIALPMHQFNEILYGGSPVEDLRHRQIVLSFVENFRTAFNRRDIGFIEQVFSDDALIIVGSVLQTPEGGMRSILTKRPVQEYFTNLRGVFARNEFINVRFEDISVNMHPADSAVYGVRLIQHWNSSTFNSVGYLYLMIDFHDIDKPLIWVRAWQPLYTPARDLIYTDNFVIPGRN